MKPTFEDMGAFMKDIRIMIDGQPYDCRTMVDAIRVLIEKVSEWQSRIAALDSHLALGLVSPDTPWAILDDIKRFGKEE